MKKKSVSSFCVKDPFIHPSSQIFTFIIIIGLESIDVWIFVTQMSEPIIMKFDIQMDYDLN